VANLLGAKIRELRKQKGLTLEQLAEKIGSGKSYIWELENKGVKRPSAEKLAKIAEVLGVTTDFLVNNSQAEVTEDVIDQAFFRKFMGLDDEDKQKVRDIVEMWSKK
jgi:transcriptional regulator with XRE-family HTH domain